MARPYRDLWELFNLGYFRRRPPYRRAKRWLSFAAAAVAVAWVAAFAAMKSSALYNSGPMSVGHTVLIENCATCHDQSFRRLRFVDDNQKAGAMNHACLSCHANTIGQDPDTQSAWHQETDPDAPAVERTLACASCHVEHEGFQRLIDMNDHHCVQCHKDLPATIAPRVQGDPPFDGFISTFHGQSTDESVHPEFEIIREKRPDPGRLKFNHRRHLAPEKFGEADGLLSPDGHVQLQCDDCHRAGESNAPWRFARFAPHDDRRQPSTESEPQLQDRYMGSIDFATHCSACHPLLTGDRDDQLVGNDMVARGEVPHSTPAAIRTYLRGQLTAYINTTPHAGLPIPTAASRTPLPLIGDKPPKEVERLKLEWVQREIHVIERYLYERKDAGCLHCHESPPTSSSGLPEIVPPAIPSRWFTHATFSHEKHKALPRPTGATSGRENCISCHQQAEESIATADVLLPGIETCRTCHAPPRGSGADIQGGAAYRCVFCHTYHRPPPPDWLLGGEMARSNPTPRNDP